MFDRFTEGARKAICLARNEARTLRQALVGTEHLLLGLARERSGGAAVVLGRLDLDREAIRNEVRKFVPGGVHVPDGEIISLTPRGLESLAAAEKAARQTRKGASRAYIGTEHVLLGVLSIPGCGAARVLDRLGKRDRACREVLRLIWATRKPPGLFGRGDPFGGADPFEADPFGDELAWLEVALPALPAPLAPLPAPLEALPAHAPPDSSLCPRGHGPMSHLLREGVHVAVCPHCLGSYFPPGELERLVRALGTQLAGPGAAEELATILWRLIDPGE